MIRIPRERVWAFAGTALVLLAVLWPERYYVPLWDGRVYANCVIDAATRGLSADTLRCAGHPSQAWAVLLAFSQSIHPGDVALLHLTDFLLGVLALAAIRVSLGRVFPAAELARELDLLTLACAIQPVVVSTLLQVNVDFGVYVFFHATLAALLTRRIGWAALAGFFLCFSKETGVLAYALVAGAYLLHRVTGTPAPWPRRIRSAVVPALVLSIPLLAFVGHVAWWNATHAQGAVWKHNWQRGTLDGFRFFDLSEPVFVSYAAGLFVLGFMWVVMGIVAFDGVVGLVRIAKRQGSRVVAGADQRLLLGVTLVTIVLTYLLTSFRTWSNLRYFALLYPLFVLLMFAALLRLPIPRHARVGAVALVVVLFGIALFRSADPLSRAVYGTYSTGVRQMYRMASITGEFTGPGRDQIVYNLEFTGYHDVQDSLFAVIAPTDSTVIAAPRLVRWNIWSQLDSTTRRRTMRRDHVFVPRYADEVDMVAMKAPSGWFLEFSNHPDDDASLSKLLTTYVEDSVISVRKSGQLLVARHLVRRGVSTQPLP